MAKFNRECLIYEVQSRPSLWREDNPNFKKKYVTDKLWDEVSKACNLNNGQEAKVKWKSLKDQFRREFQKISASGASTNAQSKWQYFQLMTFIKDYLSPNKMENNFVGHSCSPTLEFNMEENDEGFLLKEEDCSVSVTSLPVEDHSSNDIPIAAKKCSKRRRDGIGEDIIHLLLEREKFKIYRSAMEKEQEDNPDLCFFKSLLPYMESFDPIEKLAVRGKIQEIVLEHYGKNQIQ